MEQLNYLQHQKHHKTLLEKLPNLSGTHDYRVLVKIRPKQMQVPLSTYRKYFIHLCQDNNYTHRSCQGVLLDNKISKQYNSI